MFVLLVRHFTFHGVVHMYAGRHSKHDRTHDDDSRYCGAITVSMRLMDAGHCCEQNSVGQGCTH